MSTEKQISEMAKIIATQRGYCIDEWSCDKSCNAYNHGCMAYQYAEILYNADCRKQSEGHWFILEYEYFTCSECGYYHPNGCDSTKEAKEKLSEGIYPKYCSECGAKMKGGAE